MRSGADKGQWVELRDDKNRNLASTSIRGSGSEEDILGNSGPDSQHHNADPLAIQKTVRYSVEYS